MKQKLDLRTELLLDLEMDEGIDYTIELELFESDGITPKDFSLTSAKVEMKTDINGSAVISFTSGEGAITYSGNLLTWTIADTKTASKGGTPYFYALETTDLLGNKSLLMQGQAIINDKATS